MASSAEPVAKTCKMPGNWFQQDYLGKVVKGWHSQGSHFSVFVLIRANSAGIKASSLSKGALSFGNLFLSLAISFQKVIPFALTLHIPPLLLKPVMLYTWGRKQLEMSHFYSPTSLLFRHKTWKKRGFSVSELLPQEFAGDDPLGDN